MAALVLATEIVPLLLILPVKFLISSMKTPPAPLIVPEFVIPPEKVEPRARTMPEPAEAIVPLLLIPPEKFELLLRRIPYPRPESVPLLLMPPANVEVDRI